MIYFFQTQLSWFFSKCHFARQSYWFKKIIYAFLLVKSLAWLYTYDLYFGNNSIVFCKPSSAGTFRDLAFWLYNSPSPYAAYLFIWPLTILSLWGLFSRRFLLLPDLLIWFIVLNIHNKLYPTLTGGNLLLNQFLFFSGFLSVSITGGKASGWQDAKTCLHNIGVIALMLQLCLVYFFSALAKCVDPDWMSGRALIQLAMIRHYGRVPGSANAYWQVFLVSLNYLIVFYQLSFPFLVWIKKIKKPFLLVGLLMHLYIGLVMGLHEFAFIMILAYIYFWPLEKRVS